MAFDLRYDLMNVAVEHSHRTESTQIPHRLVSIRSAPAPGFIDGPQRHVRKYHDRSAGGAPLQIRLEPFELRLSECSKSVGLEVEHVDQADEMHALVIEAVVAAPLRRLAVAIEIFARGRIGDVVLAGGGVQFGDAQL